MTGKALSHTVRGLSMGERMTGDSQISRNYDPHVMRRLCILLLKKDISRMF